MELNEKTLKKIVIITMIALLAILVFIILKPVLLSIIGGLILAYTLFPVYKRIKKIVKYKTLAAAIVSILIIAVIAVPLWFLIPVMVEQIFNLFQLSQGLEIHNFIIKILPSGSDQFAAQVATATNGAISKLTSLVLNKLVDTLLNFPIIALHLLLVAFVFFFALKEEESLREFVSGLSPLNKTHEKTLIKQFSDITKTLIYGQFVIGLVQGIFAGIGFFVFKVPNALVLTAAATVFSLIPVIGPSPVYIPIAIFMLLTGNPVIAIIFLLYNILVVSTIDNILRINLVSRKTKMSQVIILIGMIGGLFIFGILGLILGPLILAYFITFLEAYKNKTLASLFST